MLDRLLPWRTSRDILTTTRPPQPDPEEKEERIERTLYEARVEYRNGDVEIFNCYGIYNRGEHYVKFNTDPYGRARMDGVASYSYDRRKINYETLAREPTVEKKGTDTFVLSWTIEYEWTRPGFTAFGDKEWVPKAKDVELTIERDGE